MHIFCLGLKSFIVILRDKKILMLLFFSEGQVLTLASIKMSLPQGFSSAGACQQIRF